MLTEAEGVVPAEFLEKLYAIPQIKLASRHLVEQLQGEGVVISTGYGVVTGAGLPRWLDFIAHVRNALVSRGEPDREPGRPTGTDRRLTMANS